MSGTETELLASALRGDRDALAALLEGHAARLRTALARKIPTRWQSILSADDVVQETFTDAFLDFQSFSPQGEGSFARWLAQLADHNLNDAIRMLSAEKRGGTRRRAQTQRDSAVALYELLGATSTTPSRCVARREAESAIRGAVRELPETYRKVVEMYDLQGRPISDVAAALGRSEGAVFMLRARAHRRLASFLGTPSRFLSGSA